MDSGYIGRGACPVCGSEKTKMPHRYPDSVLLSCRGCGTNFLIRSGRPGKQKKYDREYFTGNHARAYGKTYLQDEQNIRSYSRRRLETIRRILFCRDPEDTARGRFQTILRRSPRRSLRLLDFGSALGLFCDEAARTGFDSVGVEISSYARALSKNKFGVRSVRALDEAGGTYEAITAWFALEHLENPAGLLKRLAGKIRPGGVLALGLPNGNGAFARFAPERYFKARPREHCFEPTVRGMRKLLSAAEFRIVRTEYFGLHPDRAGWPDNALTRALQKFLKLGDTFEIYAKKLPASRPHRRP